MKLFKEDLKMNDDITMNIVEDAPENIDLDALLGLEEVDLGNDNEPKESKKKEKEEIVFDNAVSDDSDIDEPHIKIPIKSLSEVLSIANQVSSAGENSFEGKIIAMKIEKGVVRFLMSDNKRNIEKDVSILNKENQFEGFVAFSSSLINRLSKVCTSVFTLIQREVENEGKKTKRYILKIIGGEVIIDNINMDSSKYLKNFSIDNDVDYSEEEIVEAVRKLYSFAATSIRSGKSIDFLGKTIETSPINGLAKFFAKMEYPQFRLSLVDSKLLHSLCNYDTEDVIKISKDGKIFVGGNFKFKTESYPVQKSVIDAVAERMFEGESAVIDANHMKQITDLSCALDTSTGNLKFNYTDEGFVNCELLTKRENSNIVMQGNANKNLVGMDEDIEVSSFNLKGALTVFPSDNVLNMRVTPDGVCYENLKGNIKVAVLGKNAGK